MARAPNTDFHIKWLHYRQRTHDAGAELLAAEAKRLNKEKTTAKYDKHSEKTVFQRNVHERFKQKLKVHEDTIQVRRNKLKLLLCAEEQEFIRETITQGQEGLALKLEEMRMDAVKLKAQREEERMKIVQEKRKLQYR